MPNPILIDIPFNETPGSTVAQDYGPSDQNAAIVDGKFVPGRNHRTAYFQETGYAEVPGLVVPLNSTYTFTVWMKADQTGNGPYNSWVIVRFAGVGRELYLDLRSSLSFWSYVVIQQETDRMRVYVNGSLRDVQLFPAGWGKPIGWAVVNDNPGGQPGQTNIEDLLIYQGVVDQPLGAYDPSGPIDPNNPVPGSTYMAVNYYVGGVNFTDFGVYVSASAGLLDNTDLKEGVVMDWPGFHGKVVDLSAPRYDERVITLSCFSYANGSDDFIDKFRSFMNAWQKAGTVRLLVLVNNRALAYEVYLARDVAQKKQWSNALMTGTFELQLREPEPVKRILKFSGTGTASITLSSTKPVNIYWGDGFAHKDVYGSGVSRSRGYSSGGDKYIIVSGVIEDLTSFSSNAQIIWSKF